MKQDLQAGDTLWWSNLEKGLVLTRTDDCAYALLLAMYPL